MKNVTNAWGILSSQSMNLRKALRVFVLVSVVLCTYAITAQASDIDETLQGKNITGVVTDVNGSVLPGVTVVVKGTTNGTVTDIDGKYSLNVSSDNAILQFSFVGMEMQEQSVAGQSVINVTLQEGYIGLEEVVAVGYGSMERNNVTGAISSIKAEEILKAPVPNVVEALRGQVSGVKVSRGSGQPGSDVDFLVRGKNSLTSGNNPLIVIDGVPNTGGSISDINSSDIASINILKDAAAASIYGASGANGVILITTKSGAQGKPELNVNVSYGVVDLAMRPQMFDGEEFVQLKREAQIGFSGDPNDAQNIKDILTDPVEYQNYMDKKFIDWHDEMLKQGTTKNVSLTLSGGTDKFHYYMNGDVYSEQGIVQHSSYDRFSFRVNADYAAFDFLTIGARVQATKSLSDETGLTLGHWGGADFGDFVGNSPLGRTHNDAGELVPTVKGDQFQYNPLWRYRESDVSRNKSRVFINPWLELKIVDGLTYRMNAFAEERLEHYNEFYSSLYSISDLSNDPVDNKMTIRWGQEMTYLWDNILNYRKVFGDHALDATLVYGIQKYETDELNTTGQGSPTDLLTYYDISAVPSSGTTVELTPGQWGKEYYVGRLGYTYGERYSATFTIRRDGSSKFGKDSRYGNFPSAAFAWNIHNENFMAGVNPLSTLKYRVSYGVMGNDNIRNFAYMATTTNASYVFNNTVLTGKTTDPENPGNPYLQWETSKQFNTGLDFGFLKNRITGTIDYYNTNTSDLLLTEKLPSTTGAVSVISNVGKTKSWGMDANILAHVLDGQFKWDVALNWAFDRNEIVSLSRYNEAVDDPANGWFIGQDIDVIYDYKFEGIYQLGEEELAAQMHPTIRNYGPGDPKIADISGPDGEKDGVIDSNDRTFLGSPTPDWYGGIRNTFSYKGFELTVLFEAVTGVEKINEYYGGLESRDNGIKVDYWTFDNPSNVFPQPNKTKQYDFADAVRLRDASFISLRNISLGYSVPKNLIANTQIKGLSFYIRGNNLKYFTDYTDAYSPEIDPWEYPITKTWTFSAKITF
jgi:TonB-linked SusC/RagA family outer membrane protein